MEMEYLSGIDGEVDAMAWYTSYGKLWTIGTIVFFTILRILLTRIGPPAAVEARETWRWRNTVISWAHAVIVGVWTMYCIAAFPGMRANPLDYVNPCLYAMIVFSTTYFIYDMTDHIIARQCLVNWEVTLHHIAVAATFIYNIYIFKCLGYTSYALLTEVSSTFLHQRRLLKLLNVDHNGQLYRVNAVLNIVFCAVFRGLPCILVPSGYYFFPVIETLGVIYFSISLFSTITLSVIQVFLFFRLYNSDFGAPTKKRVTMPASSTTDLDNNDIKMNGNGKAHAN